MIEVDRRSVAPPAVLQGKEVLKALAEARAHFAAEDSAARQHEFKFGDFYQREEVRAALDHLFMGKCAFCESSLADAAIPVVHHFRPKQEAVDAQGNVSRPHYWWLAYRWENLYLSCRRCGMAAAAKFPVTHARAEIGMVESELLEEGALLLDPCRDEPRKHLEFVSDGTVFGLTKRGTETIDVFDLNRQALVEARHQAIAIAHRLDGQVSSLDPSTPYLEAIRQVVERAAEPRFGSTFSTSFPPVIQRALDRLNQPPALSRVLVERLELRDFRGIESLSLDLAGPDDKAPWTMLLGENGHGKSSVLQALALLLMGRAQRRKLKLRPEDLIRQGAPYAEVVAQLRGGPELRSLRINKDGFEGSHEKEPMALAAYGAARIPPPQPHWTPRHRFNRATVENLFEPSTPLIATERWLSDLDDSDFDFAARALRRLLLKPEETVVEIRPQGVVLRTPVGIEYLSRLSDGYRSMIALAADIRSFFMTRYGSMDAAEGIVLVDEIGAHLHPRWQMRIVRAFREAFPRLQFVATTHDPLCLRGLDGKREVVVLRRTETGKIYALPSEEVPSVSGLRVDELLTSEVFGLSSTIDPILEQDFNRYYSLLGSSPAHGPSQRSELAELRERLDQHRQLGANRRERLALEAADEYLAREGDVVEKLQRAELLDVTKERLRAIWNGEID
jgi:uncharacterized protein (TIGR02646 family)